jgi:hypothetical protein
VHDERDPVLNFSEQEPSVSKFALRLILGDGKFANLRRENMKKLIVICFAIALVTCGMVSAQDTMKKDDAMKADAAKGAIDVNGKISADGKTFVSDKDSKSWTIVNPEAVKGHEGHHVTLNAHVYADKGEVHVMSLKMMK